jgi:hypothetical protein
MALRLLNFVAIWSVILTLRFSSSTALISSPDHLHPKAFSDLKEAIVKGLGFQADDFKISGFDLRDALVGRSVAYEFDVEIDDKILPFKLLEDVNRWEYVDLPIFRVDESRDKNGLVKPENKDDGLPVLAPFQLAGPMEIWIQDAKDMRISLPHDVDAGVLKKVILAEGAVVTVKGARSVSLRHPVEFPLPLNKSQTGFASALLTLANQLRHAAQGQKTPLISLRIVGPTSLASPSSPSSPSRLKLKRLAPGLVELFRPIPTVNLQEPFSAVDVLTPTSFTALWPVTSVNGSHPNLRGFESLLTSVLGPKANEKGSFKLVKADVAAQTFVKIGFGVEKKLNEKLVGFPEWRTKPENVRIHFEVLAKIDGDKVVAERVVQVNPVEMEDSLALNLLNGNVTVSRVPVHYVPQNPMTL